MKKAAPDCNEGGPNSHRTDNMADDNLLLTEMQGVRAFILYRAQWTTDSKGQPKLDKVPTSARTGYDCSPHDPAEWMLPAEAQMWADAYNAQGLPSGCIGFGVGVVISEQITLPNGLRLFCLDLDHCRDGDRWQPHAISFCARFPGAAVECSVSGTGLHVFGSYRGERPDHGVKNKTYRMELYTRLRFIAVTGQGATGSMLTDHTEALHALARDYFPPHDDDDFGDTLSEVPVPSWAGPEDDDELIRRACRSASAGAVFGGKAAFVDLWNGNGPILARVFPPTKNTVWDESSADLALANHLAFWTGNHGVRMERLMRRSGLVRDKWDVRPLYLTKTINRACGSQKEWYKDPRAVSALSHLPTVPAPPAPTAQPTEVHAVAATDNAGGVAFTFPVFTAAPPAPTPAAPPAPGTRPAVGDLLTLQDQLNLFAGCVYVQDVHQILMPQGYLLDEKRFDAEFSGYTFLVTADGQRPAKRAWDAFVYSEIFQFPKVKGTFFDPRRPPREMMYRDNWTYINSFVPVEVPRRPGDVTPFLRHLKKILPNGNDADILLAYFAAVVQYPGHKFQWWPLIQGVEGNGKTILSELLQEAVGRRFTHWPKAAQVGNKFNAAFYGKILVLVEDVYISEARGSLWEALKPMITGRQMEIEGKGVDQVTREICFNGVLNTNHKNGIRKTRNDRRICPFFCAQQHESDLIRDGLDEDYFNELRAWITTAGPVVADFLLTYSIPEQWNPATRAIRAPKTTATEEAITAGLGVVEQEVLEAVEQGSPGFRNGWISSTALDKLLGVLGKSQTIPRNKRRDLLETLGFSPHPALPDGRATVNDTDGSRPRLYVRKDAVGADEVNPNTVMLWYQAAQR